MQYIEHFVQDSSVLMFYLPKQRGTPAIYTVKGADSADNMKLTSEPRGYLVCNCTNEYIIPQPC